MKGPVFEYIAKYGFKKVVLCHNADVGLKAVIAIHSTDLGPATGGLRMWTYDTEEAAIMDALRLARGMTYKYAAAGVNLGGGKAVIIGDPRTEKTEGLMRAMGRFIGSLGGEYQTGEDVGTTLDDMETLYGETDHVVTLPEYCGGAGNIGPATAFGVQQAMKACAREVWGSDSLRGRVVAMQGLGAVGWPQSSRLLGRCRLSPAFGSQGGQQSVRWIDNLGGPILEYERDVHPELVVIPGAAEPVFLRITQQGHEQFITYRVSPDPSNSRAALALNAASSSSVRTALSLKSGGRSNGVIVLSTQTP